MNKKLNEGLNTLKEYQAKCCRNCGRSYPDTILNIEGHIHHNRPIVCVDTSRCEAVRLADLKRLKAEANAKREKALRRGSRRTS